MLIRFAHPMAKGFHENGDGGSRLHQVTWWLLSHQNPSIVGNFSPI